MQCLYERTHNRRWSTLFYRTHMDPAVLTGVNAINYRARSVAEQFSAPSLIDVGYSRLRVTASHYPLPRSTSIIGQTSGDRKMWQRWKVSACVSHRSSIGSQHDATRICCWAPARLQHGARSYRSISPDRRALRSKPAGRRCWWRSMGQTHSPRRTDGRTDPRPLHKACSAY